MKKPLQGTVSLPGSKSESNRALMIAAYAGFPLEVEGLSEAHDTVLLQKLLRQVNVTASEGPVSVDCEDAGTVVRFMMTYLACKQGTWLLRGTERMCQRPMAALIEALRQLGGNLECVGEKGSLPVRITGVSIQGGSLEIDASDSSQFVSSLLLAAPMWPEGLQLKLTGELNSLSYIDMTLAIMRHFGADAVRDGRSIIVNSKPYKSRNFVVSSDWSSASYWYEMMALSDEGNLLLKGLKKASLQGDAVVAEWFKSFGVMTSFEEDGARLTKKNGTDTVDFQELIFDFTNTPDLFPAVFVTCKALQKQAAFKGVSTLHAKESDRIAALNAELSKISSFDHSASGIVFRTYRDHRIAMALASLWPLLGPVTVDDPSVVGKSYPGFWEELIRLS